MKHLRLIVRRFCVLSLALGASYSPLAFADGFTTIDPPGALSSKVYGINPQGDIVGQYTDTGGKTHGFLLSNTGASN